MPKIPPVKTVCAHFAMRHKLSQYPNFSTSGNIAGMRKLYYGKCTYLLRFNGYIYHVPENVYLNA